MEQDLIEEKKTFNQGLFLPLKVEMFTNGQQRQRLTHETVKPDLSEV